MRRAPATTPVTEGLRIDPLTEGADGGGGSGEDRPVVTVIIPTYQRAHMIGHAIESVLCQTYEDWELLVVDDASTDGTAARMAEYEDSRIRYVRQEKNAGAGAARNDGMRRGRGEFFAFLDSDDDWLPRKLELQLERFRTSELDPGLVYTGAFQVCGPGQVHRIIPEWRGDLFDRLLLQNVLLGGGSSVMIRRVVWETVGGFDEELPAIEDFEYWVRVARDFSIDAVPEPLVRWNDVRIGDRRSLDWRRNLQARDVFFVRYRGDMEAAGVAHLFLQYSIRRHLTSVYWDATEARRLCRIAMAIAPWSGRTYLQFLTTLVPRRLYAVAAAIKRRIFSGPAHE